jgi:hypothetical protein
MSIVVSGRIQVSLVKPTLPCSMYVLRRDTQSDQRANPTRPSMTAFVSKPKVEVTFFTQLVYLPRLINTPRCSGKRAAQKGSASAEMQPPTPFNRTNFPVPAATRRPRASASNSNLKGGPARTPTPRLLAAAAAVTASRTWVLNDQDVTSGVGLLVLALAGGRLWREVIERRRDRKGKRKEIGGAEVMSLVSFDFHGEEAKA